jgi:hypothetical protein
VRRNALRLAALGALVWITGASGLVACGGTDSSAGDCPSKEVRPDAAVTDLPPNENYQLGGACLSYCPDGYSVCQLRAGNVVRCMQNCG